MNVFKYGYHGWKYLSCWFYNIKQFFRNIKYAYQRITKGYCDWDIWNLNNYYSELLIATLRYYKDNLHGCPQEFFDENNENDEAQPWKDYIQEIITHLCNASSDEDELNEYYEEFLNGCPLHEDVAEFNKKYFDRSKEICEWQNDEIHTALKMLADHWFQLWD